MICSSSFLASAGQTAIKSQTSQPQATLEEWLEKWNKRQKKTKAMSGKSAPQPTYTLPPGLPPLQQLPPSLLPPPPSGYPELPRVEWGWCSLASLALASHCIPATPVSTSGGSRGGHLLYYHLIWVRKGPPCPSPLFEHIWMILICQWPSPPSKMSYCIVIFIRIIVDLLCVCSSYVQTTSQGMHICETNLTSMFKLFLSTGNIGSGL